MTDFLTLEDARNAIGVPDNDTSKDLQLEQTYIPATTAVVEDLLGPVMSSERTYTADGGVAAIMLPWLNVTSVASVVEAGVTLTADDDYVANLASGIIYRGTATVPADYAAGRQSIVVTYTAGTYEEPDEVPANVRLAARIILAHLWQADQQGFRPDFGGPDNSTALSPSGYAVPRRALELLGTMASNRPLGVA